MAEAPTRKLRSAYGRRMPRLTVVPRLPALEKFAGLWVAVKDGRVVASAATSRDLVAQVQQGGEAMRGAVAQYVSPPTDAVTIGVG